ncbi:MULTISPECIES: histidine kinase [unclassified Microbacterium]|uniref:sensor histidine kinase n=1 Tax=unclassified Microbacterium TaxID=2609290 RepID=UPI00214BD23E|nr:MULTISPECIES: histidine kinase [unclassified Microbacterium]MCR2808786.1 histidine kinase [Microbacterium sp. zg.B185]WIM18790.1 histidine kinase [Microbacterium sp. zg-B185]
MFRPLKTYQVVVDLVVSAAFLSVALPVEIVLALGSGTAPENAAVLVSGAVAIGLIFSAALAVRRWSPALALGLAWAGAVVQMSLARPPSVADVAIFGVLYATAAYGTQRVYWAGFASALSGALVITVYLFASALSTEGLSVRTISAAVAVLVAAAFALLLAWTVGALVRMAIRARENRVAQERAEAEAAVEQERLQIARDMHDVVAHSLAVVIAQADGARYAAPADPTAATQALGTISTTARAALADVRLLLTRLRHSETGGPQPTLADLEELYAQVRATGVTLRVEVDPAPVEQPSAAVQLAVYRILQEALTNGLRHGGGSPVDVTLGWHPDHVALEVRNRLKTGERPKESGHGLIGMGERASLVGGRLNAADRDGWFVVEATLPIRAGAAR